MKTSPSTVALLVLVWPVAAHAQLTSPYDLVNSRFVELSVQIGNIALSAVDVSLLLLCPVCATLGVLVSFVLKGRERHSHEPGVKAFLLGIWVNVGFLFIGLVLGLVVALFFVGAVNNEVTSLARVLALAILLGYQAPHLWMSQEVFVRKVIAEELAIVVEQKHAARGRNEA